MRSIRQEPLPKATKETATLIIYASHTNAFFVGTPMHNIKNIAAYIYINIGSGRKARS